MVKDHLTGCGIDGAIVFLFWILFQVVFVLSTYVGEYASADLTHFSKRLHACLESFSNVVNQQCKNKKAMLKVCVLGGGGGHP